MEILRIMQVAPGRYQLEVVSQTTVGEALLALEQARALAGCWACCWRRW